MNLDPRMQPTTAELRERYAELTDEELLRMHASGQLTEFAYTVIESEIAQRGMSIPRRADQLLKSIAAQDQRFWSFSTWAGDTAFRLLLIFWLTNAIALFIPFLGLAPVLGVDDWAGYASGLRWTLFNSVAIGTLNTIPIAIYMLIWALIFGIKIGEPIHARQLCSLGYGAIGVIAPMSAFSTLIYIIDWEWISSGAGLPMDAAQGIGIGYMFVALCAQLPG